MDQPSERTRRRRDFPAFRPIHLATLLAAGLPLGVSAAAPSPSPEFLRYWKSGLAELSSYAVTTARYGESRQGEGVLVFVYEEIDDKTRIKVETDGIPAERRVPVLKLNNVLKFNTGVYDYSVMTSVFAGLSGPGVSRILEPRKISFSSQEWCGHVYHQVVPRPRGLASTLHSYFEAEGDAQSMIPYPAGDGKSGGAGRLHYEDEMPILVRELDGEFLAPGGERTLHLLPSLWERRKRHAPLAVIPATLAKGRPEAYRARTDAKPAIQAVKWTLSWEGHAMAYWVEADPPRRLLAWDDGRGEKGELVASLRKTYWTLNRNQDLPLRKELGLTYGVGGR